jgi:hypothetical protein
VVAVDPPPVPAGATALSALGWTPPSLCAERPKLPLSQLRRRSEVENTAQAAACILRSFIADVFLPSHPVTGQQGANRLDAAEFDLISGKLGGLGVVDVGDVGRDREHA